MDGSRQLYECVPNFSEGRDLELVETLADKARAAGVAVADITSDADHHRSVMTWFGTASAIGRAASDCLSALARHCERAGRSLADQVGVHPRTGLLDVLPLIPLSALGADPSHPWTSSMDDAVSAARSISRQLARRHAIPIYWYEQAASAPDRSNLAHHRRALLSAKPGDHWPADAGNCHPYPHPLKGAVLVGARAPLVAFNMDLDTTDLRIARRIAARIRATARQGLPGVKALGLALDQRGCAQVSVNLVDARATSLLALVERVSALAQAEGTTIRSSELIGLATEEAINGATAKELLLPDLDPKRTTRFHLEQLADAER